MTDTEFVDWCFQRVLGRAAGARERLQRIAALERGADRLAMLVEFLDCQEYSQRLPPIRPFAPQGHFYSPEPSPQDIQRALSWADAEVELPGIEVREKEQLNLLQELKRFYDDLPFSDHPGNGCRYGYDNVYFGHADAIFLYSLIRKFSPRRIVEVGSGWSSAVMLDTNELFMGKDIELTFIEPYPDRLNSLLSKTDKLTCKIIKQGIQSVPPGALIDSLEAGDFLFIDSSHVSKAGSDVNYLLSYVLPHLRHGVLVHVHDIFWPFEYPRQFFDEGRFWNEAYALRSFLTCNSCFQIRLFGNFIVSKHQAWFRENMPLCERNFGGSIWLERI